MQLPPTDPLDCGEDLAVGLEVELLPQTLRVTLDDFDGVGPIPDGGERPCLLEHEMRIQWIVLHAPRPPFRRLSPGLGTFRGRRQLLQRLSVLARQSGALSVQPPLELRGIVHMEAIEQRTAVNPHRIGRSTRAERLREGTSVGTDDR